LNYPLRKILTDHRADFSDPIPFTRFYWLGGDANRSLTSARVILLSIKLRFHQIHGY
jgi:hypothetical protein